MKNFEMPFLNSNKSVQVTYTEKGLVDVSLKRKKAKENSVKDPMGKKIQKTLSDYFNGKNKDLDFPIDWQNIPGTDFQKKVWKQMQKIPYGKVKTYGELAKSIGSPKAFRAVGSACGKNHVLLFVPCHRVIGSSTLGGFSCGLDIKEQLHSLENISIQ